MPRLVRGLLLAIVTLASLPAIAGAHPGNPDFRSVFQRFSPQISGVNVQVLNWDSNYQLSDPGHHTVVIYGYDHDQYARMFVAPLVLAFAAAVWRGLARARRATWEARRRACGPRR